MFTDFLAILKEELKKELPGEKAQIKMAPGVRNYYKPKEKSREAGVLILLYQKREELYVSFIQRTEYNGPHSGQISFPGGKKEKGDHNIIDTALRESNEEIGIDPNLVSLYGQLTPLHIPISNFIVFPVIGTYPKEPEFIIEPSEVKKIIEVKLKDLLNAANCTTKDFKYGDLSFTAPIYNPNNVTIWGATAMILSEFLEIVKMNLSKFPE